MIPAITVDWLLARVVKRDGCLIWNGRCENGGKHPRARLGQVDFYVRRAVWAAMHNGRQLPTDREASVTCGHARCVDPAHVLARPRAAGLKGVPKPAATRAKIAAAKRATSKLPQEKVSEILLSPLKAKDEAIRHGICTDMVNKIRAFEVRRDFSSPFSGLVAR